jgi:hypothetical protein
MYHGESFETPVALILFNRPARIRELIQTLRIIRPTTILAIADGPRASHPTDIAACQLARTALDEIDWPCRIEREFSPVNLGCDQRILSGLDWVFSRVGQAIVLEDDILPHPSFLPWAAAMLERFGSDPKVGLISGRNPLGFWGDPDPDHIRGYSGSIWGWACTAHAWRRMQALDLGADASPLAVFRNHPFLDPLWVAHHCITLEMFHRGELTAWDVLLSLRGGLLGLQTISSPVNLTRNTGIGPDATRTLFANDFRALLPARESRPIQATSNPQPLDPDFDRAALMVQLLARCRNPVMAGRLNRLIQRGTHVPLDAATRHHLAPFIHADESLRLLEHLAAQGLSSPSFDQLRRTIRSQAECVTTP